MPELIDWMNFSLVACGRISFFHMPDETTTSASPTRFRKSSGVQAWKLFTPVLRNSKRACIW